MSLAPLYVKFQNRSGNYYVYDPGTGEIARVNRTVFEILGDYHILDVDEIADKHRHLGRANICEALTQLDALQSRGIFCDHTPQPSLPVERLRCEGQEEPLAAALRHRRRHLILEITQRCNLRCEYCCYGKHYPEYRKHSEETMSLETAKNAIREYVSHKPEPCSIGLYGGEPLLEFELIRQIVFFAEELASQHGLKAEFNLTTNGTLLTDERIHFLVEHDVDVMVSFDGDKETHDRYRIFRNDKNPGQRLGSYDVVAKNLRRFVELYPNYPNRTLGTTITAKSDIDGINEVYRHWRPQVPSIQANFVRDVSNDSQEDASSGCLGIGCWGALPCDAMSCTREQRRQEVRSHASEVEGYSSADGEILGQPSGGVEFGYWTDEDLGRFASHRSRFINELSKAPDASGVLNDHPLLYDLFVAEYGRLHHRQISNTPAKYTFSCRCLPGAARTFCSSQGRLYPCERTETGRLMEIGDAERGVDVTRSLRLARAVSLLGDCGNCTAKRACSMCLSSVSECRNCERADAVAFRRKCGTVLADLPVNLEEYTAPMETNFGLIDNILGKKQKHDWLDDVMYIPTEKQIEERKWCDEVAEEVL